MPEVVVVPPITKGAFRHCQGNVVRGRSVVVPISHARELFLCWGEEALRLYRAGDLSNADAYAASALDVGDAYIAAAEWRRRDGWADPFRPDEGRETACR